MLASYNWIKEFVEIPWSAEKLADKLTSSGLAVDNVIDWGTRWQGIVVGEILRIEAHPQNPPLLVCDVTTGQETVSLVCGAKNVKVGDKVPLALPGAVLPSSGKRLEKTTIVGVESIGMLCSSAELELGTDASGIMILSPKVKTGGSLTRALHLQDWILETDPTPNRPDQLSIYGIAREVSALSGKPLKKILFKLKEGKERALDLVSVKIEKSADCPRYVATIISGVEIGPSPDWLARRLYAAGQKPINNVVDVTNLVLLELGQPLHAFDFNLFPERKVLVRRAKAKEEIVTLDAVERVLDESILLVTDGSKPVALAGIMGGENTEVSQNTKNILLESAYFSPRVIRAGRKKVGLSTEASTRFEKGADPNIALFAANRVCALIAESAGGEVAQGAVDVYQRKIAPKKVVLRVERLNQVLDTELSAPKVVKTLKSLQFDITGGKTALRVTVPTFRQDISLEEDLIEEVARIYGYDNIPASIQNKGVLEVSPMPEEAWFDLIRRTLVGWGFQEVVTNSIVDPRRLALFGEEREPVHVKNPITSDQSVLRTNLALSTLGVIVHNQNRKQPDLKLFEIGKVYWMEEGKPKENYQLCVSVTGRRFPKGWDTPGDEVDFFDLKGVVEGLSEAGGWKSLQLAESEESIFNSRFSFSLQGGSESIARLGQIKPALLEAFDIKNGVFLAEIELEPIISKPLPEKRFQALPRYPAVERDIAILVDRGIPAQAIVDKIKAWAGGLAEEVKLFDVYSGKQVPLDKKSLAFYIRYRSKEGTLTEAEVGSVQEKVIQNLQREFGAQLRS